MPRWNEMWAAEFFSKIMTFSFFFDLMYDSLESPFVVNFMLPVNVTRSNESSSFSMPCPEKLGHEKKMKKIRKVHWSFFFDLVFELFY